MRQGGFVGRSNIGLCDVQIRSASPSNSSQRLLLDRAWTTKVGPTGHLSSRLPAPLQALQDVNYFTLRGSQSVHDVV